MRSSCEPPAARMPPEKPLRRMLLTALPSRSSKSDKFCSTFSCDCFSSLIAQQLFLSRSLDSKECSTGMNILYQLDADLWTDLLSTVNQQCAIFYDVLTEGFVIRCSA